MGFARKITGYMTLITMEPALIILFSGLAFANITTLIGGYYKTCQLYFDTDIGTDCNNLAENHASEISVQKTYTGWQTWYLLAALLPAIPVDLIISE